jgi:ubiquinone/menaquinone biosynthesis C-methylase UbiE
MREERAVVDVFERAAPHYLGNYDRRDPEGAAFVVRRRRVAAMLDRVTAGPVLDVGCGPGIMAAEVRRRGFDYVGVDASPEMIRSARERSTDAGRLDLGVADIAALPFAAGCFGAVLCMGVLEYLGDAEAAVDEMVRVTRPGGLLVMTLPNGASPYRRWTQGVYAPTTAGIKRALGRPTTPAMPRRAFHIAAWCRGLEARGLGIETVVGYGYNPLLPPLDKMFPGAAARLASALEACGDSAARGLGTGFIVGVRVRG